MAMMNNVLFLIILLSVSVTISSAGINIGNNWCAAPWSWPGPLSSDTGPFVYDTCLKPGVTVKAKCGETTVQETTTNQNGQFTLDIPDGSTLPDGNTITGDLLKENCDVEAPFPPEWIAPPGHLQSSITDNPLQPGALEAATWTAVFD